MLDNLKRIDSLNMALLKLDADELNRLYLRVFDCPDGELVLQDLANRCFQYDTTEGNEIREGMRALYLSIQTRILNAVAKKENVDA